MHELIIEDGVLFLDGKKLEKVKSYSIINPGAVCR